MNYQPLFDHMSQEHGLTLTEGEMLEIIHVVNKIQGSDGDRWVSKDAVLKLLERERVRGVKLNSHAGDYAEKMLYDLIQEIEDL